MWYRPRNLGTVPKKQVVLQANRAEDSARPRHAVSETSTRTKAAMPSKVEASTRNLGDVLSYTVRCKSGQHEGGNFNKMGACIDRAGG